VIIGALDSVSKHFGVVAALDAVTLDLHRGDMLALLGPNGAGKSTAIAVLLGLRAPDAGQARLFGLDPRRPTARRLLGVTPQETAFPQTLRVTEIVELIRRHYPQPLAPEILYERFEIGALARRQLGGLSGGERRRVAVALAFAGNPELVVLDEPTTGLDRDSRLGVWAAIRAHADQGGTVLFTTHYLEEADALAHRVVLIETGRIVADGTVSKIKAAAGLTRISFRAPPGIELDGATRDGDLLRMDTHDGGHVVEQLVRRGVPLVDLEVRALTLEEALVARQALR
jgi:ABC-2 type transport system ATP-binding protein